MKYFLIYCYITNQYHLIENTMMADFEESELLFEFEENERRIGEKVLNNLRIEKTKRDRSNFIVAA